MSLCRQLNWALVWKWFSLKPSPPSRCNAPACSQKENITHFPQMGAGQVHLRDPWCPSLQCPLMRFVLGQMVCTRGVSGSTGEKGQGATRPSNTDAKNKSKKRTMIPSSHVLLPNLSLAEQMARTDPVSSTSKLLKTVELPARGEFGLISFLSMKEMESLGVWLFAFRFFFFFFLGLV